MKAQQVSQAISEDDFWKEVRRGLVDRLGITDEEAMAVHKECEKDFSKAYAYLEREYAEMLEF